MLFRSVVTRTHPLLPLNIAKATYLLPPPDTPLSTTALIVTRAIVLQKCWLHLTTLASNVYAACIKATMHFEQEHAVTIMDFHFKLSDLILIGNTAIEKLLNRKMRVRYLGPLIIISQNKGGAYCARGWIPRLSDGTSSDKAGGKATLL